MKTERLVIWYNNQKDEYLINKASEIKSGACQYREDVDNILYIMEPEHAKLARKIRDRMNDVRKMADLD